MAMRRQGQRRDLAPARSPTREFGSAAQSLVPGSLLGVLQKLQHDIGPRAAMKKDGLVITLHADHFLGGHKILTALAQMPDIEHYLFFKDRQAVRPCKDVVFDLEIRGLEFARLLYLNPSPQKYILMTPPVRGSYASAPDVLDCAVQHVTNRYGRDVSIHTDITPDGFSWYAEKKEAGIRHAIQTSHVQLEIIEQDMSAMRLKIKSGVAMSHEYKIRTEPAQHVFTFN